MSFRAAIENQERLGAWYRGIYVLSSISDKIKLTISKDDIILWSIHSTDTSLCQLRYEASFFDEFVFEPYDIVFGESGLQIETDLKGHDHKLYSFEIDAKQLTTVSRKPDNDIIRKYSLSINNTTTCSESLINKLLVAIEMESLIMKEYCPQFQPIKYTPIVLDLQYKRKFLDVFGSNSYDKDYTLDPNLIACFIEVSKELSNSLFNKSLMNQNDLRDGDRPLESSDEINYINCNYGLIKNFVDNCQKSIFDDVKLELLERKMAITAFVKGTFKGSEILQNALSMSNTMNTADIGHYCLFDGVEEEHGGRSGQKKSPKTLIFKLRDFKNFIGIGNSWKNIPITLSASRNNDLSIWFCHPGEPILFQMNKGGVRAQLLLVTDSTVGSSTIKSKEPTANNQMSNPSMDTSRAASPLRLNSNTRLQKTETASNLNSRSTSPFKLVNSDIQSIPLRDNRMSPLKDTAIETTTNERLSSAGKVVSARKLFVSDASQESNIDYPNVQNDNTSKAEQDMLAQLQMERSETTIGWGNRSLKEFPTKRPSAETRNPKKQHKMSPGEDADKGAEEQDAAGLGPTQAQNPKGLFD
ncbi:Ddc1p KNAG_0D05110 [Huiozyma naganishii CBS 8797]|uniref:Uncharacterized protein n=1 Tax=Huiozyma naganishii (strain ATCC MYA-139 / BCRC 22969 / CBS 8797 / KCTC 17520 / NBRC 10181 / NCYC 3082 / Yp74L-3) TaxID=1071383 RepID=J7R5W2_HUIN7|nr:hypothetical protein KNAG_0D05110 [Kazachstania naganishii CBS 8797]CCK70250.1 hypothetical protein KNAG_0D05110 [Kazachstania naganishii CBS 8797]